MMIKVPKRQRMTCDDDPAIIAAVDALAARLRVSRTDVLRQAHRLLLKQARKKYGTALIPDTLNLD